MLLTDGVQNEGLPAKQIADQLKASNTTIFGIGVGRGVDKREIEQWVTAPAPQHYYEVSAFDKLEVILKQIIAACCPPHPHPPSSPSMVEFLI